MINKYLGLYINIYITVLVYVKCLATNGWTFVVYNKFKIKKFCQGPFCLKFCDGSLIRLKYFFFQTNTLLAPFYVRNVSSRPANWNARHTQVPSRAHQMWRNTDDDGPVCGEGGAGEARGSELASTDIHIPGEASGSPESSRTASGTSRAEAWVCAIKCPRWRTTSTSAVAPVAPETCSSDSWWRLLSSDPLQEWICIFDAAEALKSANVASLSLPQDENGSIVACVTVR